MFKRLLFGKGDLPTHERNCVVLSVSSICFVFKRASDRKLQEDFDVSFFSAEI